MQTLFNKIEKLRKQNNSLIKIFFINLIFITILVMNKIEISGIKFLILKLFPLINLKTLIILLCSIIVAEIIIVKKIDNNDKMIKRLNHIITRLKNETEKETEKENSVSKKKQVNKNISNQYSYNQNYFQEDKNYYNDRVKRKVLK